MKHASIAFAFALAWSSTGWATESADKVAAVMEDFHSRGHFNGSVLVARGADVLYSGAFGMADVESDVPNKPDTRFRIASVTKGFTAVLALQAVDRGEFDLDKRISDYLPEVTNEALAAVTVDHLLTHKSGIEDFAPQPSQPGQSVREALIERLNEAKLVSTPGETHAYCNVGYTLLGFLLENATGETYEALLAERVFKPLGMVASYLEGGPDEDYPIRAKGYAKSNGQLTAEEEADLSLFPAAGGIVSTASDLLLFSRALTGAELLGQASREKMLADSSGNHQYGCLNRQLPNGDRVQIFQGGMPGSSSLLLRVNDGEYTIVLLANESDVKLQPIAMALLMALLQS